MTFRLLLMCQKTGILDKAAVLMIGRHSTSVMTCQLIEGNDLFIHSHATMKRH